MEDIIKSLKDLSIEITQSQNNDTKTWLATTANLYEKLLTLNYLEQRKHSLNAIEESVKQNINAIVDSAPIEIESVKANTNTAPVLGNEIRRVPHPEGPPTMPNQTSIYDEIPAALNAKKEVTPGVIKEATTEKKNAVKVEDVILDTNASLNENKTVKPKAKDKVSIAEKAVKNPKKSINEKLSGQTLKFGLNDRIAFVKHLFNGSQEDFNRVVSQLNSFTDLSEAQNFIEHIVKPEYNWKNKDDFEARFIESIENKYA